MTTSDSDMTAVVWATPKESRLEDIQPEDRYDIGVVLQDRVWANWKREPILLVDMQQSYLRNVLTMLSKDSPVYSKARFIPFRNQYGSTVDASESEPSQDLESLYRALEVDEKEWLESSPLVLEIRRLLA